MITLREPLKNPVISQKFGKDFTWFNPNKQKWEWFYKDTYGLLGHPGIDYACIVGTPIYSAHDGVCLYTGFDNANGSMVQIWDEARGFKTLYGHLSEFRVNQGDTIKAGQLIALSGNTGGSTGPHLHWGYRETIAGGNTKYPNNGYHGCVDQLPFTTKDYLGNNLKNDMTFKKEKNGNAVYLINEEFGTKIMVIDMPTLDAFHGQIEEVDSLNQYVPFGTMIWSERVIN